VGSRQSLDGSAPARRGRPRLTSKGGRKSSVVPWDFYDKIVNADSGEEIIHVGIEKIVWRPFTQDEARKE